MNSVTPSDPSSSTRKFDAKREALVLVASKLFNERGVIGTTLSDVAGSVGLIKNSVTYYYRRKEDLSVACFMRAIEVCDELVGKAAKEPTVSARVTALLRLHVELQDGIHRGTHPAIVVFHEIRALPSPHKEAVFAAYTSMFRRAKGLLVGPDTQLLGAEHLNARAHILLSLVNSLRIVVRRYAPEDHARTVQRLADIVLNGIHGPTATWSPLGAEKDWLDNLPERSPAEAFLRAAIELINEQGYGGASVTKISERLNMTKGAFYYYNDNKEELIEQCFQHSVGVIRKAIRLTEGFGGGGWDHLCSIARGLARFQLSADGPLLRSTANSAFPDQAHRARVSEEVGRMTERIASVVVEGLMDGSARPVDPTLAAHHVFMCITAASELKRWVRSATEENTAEIYVRPMLMGLVSPA